MKSSFCVFHLDEPKPPIPLPRRKRMMEKYVESFPKQWMTLNDILQKNEITEMDFIHITNILDNIHQVNLLFEQIIHEICNKYKDK